MDKKLLGFLSCGLGELWVLLKCFLDWENCQEADKVQDINGKMRTRGRMTEEGERGARFTSQSDSCLLLLLLPLHCRMTLLSLVGP